MVVSHFQVPMKGAVQPERVWVANLRLTTQTWRVSGQLQGLTGDSGGLLGERADLDVLDPGGTHRGLD